jgi:hypothetical protein
MRLQDWSWFICSIYLEGHHWTSFPPFLLSDSIFWFSNRCFLDIDGSFCQKLRKWWEQTGVYRRWVFPTTTQAIQKYLPSEPTFYSERHNNGERHKNVKYSDRMTHVFTNLPHTTSIISNSTGTNIHMASCPWSWIDRIKYVFLV